MTTTDFAYHGYRLAILTELLSLKKTVTLVALKT